MMVEAPKLSRKVGYVVLDPSALRGLMMFMLVMLLSRKHKQHKHDEPGRVEEYNMTYAPYGKLKSFVCWFMRLTCQLV